MSKKAKPAPIPEDFDPVPTVFTGGIERMLKTFEALRDVSPKGYTGGSIVAKVKGWSVPNNGGTSCSPFTASILGMLYDPSGATDAGTSYAPVYNVTADRQEPLPVQWYLLHQGANISPVLSQRVKKAGRGGGLGSAESLVAFHLGYRIDPKDMRRGDFVGIDWHPAGGHATFCWDVHLNDKGEVDCFQFVSANGCLKPEPHGPGITVGTSAAKIPLFLKKSGDDYTKKFNPLFEDREEYVEHSSWYCLPGLTKEGVDKKSFRKEPKHVTSGGAIAALSVVRLFGFEPPGDASHPRYKPAWAEAAKVAQWPAPPSYAMGGDAATQDASKPAPTFTEVKPQKVPKEEVQKDPKAIEKAPPEPKEQKKENLHGHQYESELKLKRLFNEGWLDTDPGEPDEVNDSQSKAAIKAFQKKFGQDDSLVVDGIAGPKTRAVLDKVIAKLEAGEADPQGKPKKEPATRIDRAYWEENRADPAGKAHVKLEGVRLDRISKVELTLTDETGLSRKISFGSSDLRADGPTPFQLPPDFLLQARLTGKLTAKVQGASDLSASIPGVLELAPADVPVTSTPSGYTPPDSLLPWDESKWPKRMRDIVAELRAAKAPSNPALERWSLTQFGVKTKIFPGDVPVLSNDGQELGRVRLESLMKADIEGTMLVNGRMLNIGNSHGWTYDKTTHKPVKGSFQPEKSRWVDVTDTKPFGAGARTPLVPFRVLAVNPRRHPDAYCRMVYIKQLDGLKLPTGEVHNGMVVVGDCGGMVDHHFDFFVGNEDRHIKVPSVGQKDGRQLVELVLLGSCESAKRKK